MKPPSAVSAAGIAMQGQLAQQIALTTHGNTYLVGTADVAWAAFVPGNGTFACCESVRFVERGGPPDARHLLAAAQASWVFGGMGSWNDVSFAGEDLEIHRRSAQELYRALNEAVIVATTPSTP